MRNALLELLFLNRLRDRMGSVRIRDRVFELPPVIGVERHCQPADLRDRARRECGQAPIAQAAPAPRPAPSVAPGSTAAAADDAFSRYTQATRYGDLLFVSGQIAIDPRTGDFDSRQNVEAQTRRVLENVRAVLEANRLTMANVVSVTVYLSRISNLSPMDSVYHDFFKGTPPARTVVEVSNLPRGALVEVSVIAGR